MNTTHAHFDRVSDDGLRITVLDSAFGYCVRLMDLAAGTVVGDRHYKHIDQALAYAEACHAGVAMVGDLVTV